MAQIQGQAGVNLSTELANYLSANQGSLTSEQLTQIINNYLTGGDKLAAQGGAISTGIYKRFGEFDYVSGKIEVVTQVCGVVILVPLQLSLLHQLK